MVGQLVVVCTAEPMPTEAKLTEVNCYDGRDLLSNGVCEEGLAILELGRRRLN